MTARGKIERDELGNAVRFPGVVIDVTEWKRAEAFLANVTNESDKKKRLYETILSNTPDLVYVFDLNHRFVYATKCSFDVEQVVGRGDRKNVLGARI